MITSLGDEKPGLYASCAFVCLSCMHYFFVFSLPLGVSSRLRIVIVVYAGLFI